MDILLNNALEPGKDYGFLELPPDAGAWPAGNGRGRGLLVVAQIAIGLVLLSGAGVLVAGFIRLLNRDLGFEPRQLLTFQAGLPGARYSEDARIALLFELSE